MVQNISLLHSAFLFEVRFFSLPSCIIHKYTSRIHFESLIFFFLILLSCYTIDSMPMFSAAAQVRKLQSLSSLASSSVLCFITYSTGKTQSTRRPRDIPACFLQLLKMTLNWRCLFVHSKGPITNENNYAISTHLFSSQCYCKCYTEFLTTFF